MADVERAIKVLEAERDFTRAAGGPARRVLGEALSAGIEALRGRGKIECEIASRSYEAHLSAVDDEYHEAFSDGLKFAADALGSPEDAVGPVERTEETP